MQVTCLSVRNPISYLICSGVKDVENRSWNTQYRGTVFIHSSGQKSQYELNTDSVPDIIVNEAERKLFTDDNGNITLKEPSDYKEYLIQLTDLLIMQNRHIVNGIERPFYMNRSIIGSVDIVDVIQDSESPFADDYSFQWILENPVLFDEPITDIKGKLNFFKVDIERIPEAVQVCTTV